MSWIIPFAISLALYGLYNFSHNKLFLWFSIAVLVLTIMGIIAYITRKFPILYFLFSGLALVFYAAGEHYHSSTDYTFAKISLALFVIQIICVGLTSKNAGSGISRWFEDRKKNYDKMQEDGERYQEKIRQMERDARERRREEREKYLVDQIKRDRGNL